MADYTPVYSPGTAFTQTTSAAVTGGQLLENTGAGTVGPASAGSLKVIGVAAHDAALGAKVTIHALAGVVHETTSSLTVTAGSLLFAGAAGTVTDGTVAVVGDVGKVVGKAFAGATAGAKVRWIGATA